MEPSLCFTAEGLSLSCAGFPSLLLPVLLLNLGTRYPSLRLQALEGPSQEAKSLGNWIVLPTQGPLAAPLPPLTF